MSSRQERYYLEKINRVIDYLEIHYASPLSVHDLAKVACLSEFHFSRIFSAFTGESLYSFITRVRLEKAGSFLLTETKTLTETAFHCGFNDSATFSRAFKKHFGISPSGWKKKKNSRIHQESERKPIYPFSMKGGIKAESIIIKHFPRREAVYFRHTGAYAGNSDLFFRLYRKIKKWGKERGVFECPESEDLVIYHDSAGITKADKLRISLCLTVPDGTDSSGTEGKLILDESDYLVCRYQLGNNDYGKAWTDVYRRVLTETGREPADSYCYEAYPRPCYNPESEVTTVDICIPLKKR